MKTLIITYDLNRQGQDYNGLIAAIKKNYPSFVHAMQSVFFIKTAQESKAVYDVLSWFVDANDNLFVGEINTWWARLPTPVTNFIKA